MQLAARAITEGRAERSSRRVLLNGAQRVEFLTITTEGNLNLSVRSLDDENAPRYTAELSIQQTPVCRASRGVMRWGMWGGIPASARNGSCPFFGAVEHARRLAVNPVNDGASLPYEKQRALERESMTVGIEAAKLAVSLCDPAVLRQSRRFAPNVRWFVYSHIMSDSTGRLAQLAKACPGAFIFALALREHGIDAYDAGGDACARLFQEVIGGVSLNRVLDSAIEAWVRVAPFQEDTELHAAWKLLRRMSPSELTKQRLQQRLLIRRAVPGVKTELLWLPPPIAFVPEDIPKGAREVARWFRFVKAYSCYQKASSPTDLQGNALCGFASAHSKKLAEASRELKRSPSNLLGDIADYAYYSDTPMPSRKSDPDQVIEATITWERDELFICSRSQRLPDDTVFPDSPGDELLVGPVHLVAMMSPKELTAEGREMRHCVATRALEANSGQAVFYRGAIGNSRVTIELVGEGGQWAVGEARGVQNRDLNRAEREDLRLWLEELRRTATRSPLRYSASDIPF